MRKLLLILLACFFFSGAAEAQKGKRKAGKSSAAPNAASIKIDFLGSPGIGLAETTWEMSYELRMLDEAAFESAVAAGKLKKMDITDDKLGVKLASGNFNKSSLADAANRTQMVSIPFSEETRKKLGGMKNRQVFLFYGAAAIYDAKLKKSIAIPLSWAWLSEVYPQAKFGMGFKVEEDPEYGFSYSTSTDVPAKLPKGHSLMKGHE